MNIPGELVTLRPWQSGDETDLVSLANNRRIWRNLTNRFPHPYTAQDASQWVAVANAHPDDTQHFAIIVGGAIVGGVGFERLGDLGTRSAEIGYWVAEPQWGRGIASQALSLASAAAFANFNFVRLQAGVLHWNPASCRVLEKAGYSLEARLRRQGFKDGEVCDILMYALLRES